jgi:hypothetical protein
VGGSERNYSRGGGSETIIFDLKVPRHCPLGSPSDKGET